MSNNISLYNLVGDFEKFTDVLEQKDITDEMKEAITDALSNLIDDIDDKVDDYGKAIKIRQANIKARKEEIDRLTALNKADQTAIDRMKDMVEKALIITGKRKVKTSMFTFYMQRNTPSVVMVEGYIENIPEEFLVYPEPTVNKTALKEALEGDDEKLKERLEGIAYLDQSESLRMK